MTFLKNRSLNSFMSVSWRNMKDYSDVLQLIFIQWLAQWHLFFFTFFFGRQVQCLRHLKGAKCEEHHHQRPWRPAMLGTRLHVVSIVTPLSPVLVSHQPWVWTQVFLYETLFIFFNFIYMWWVDSSSLTDKKVFYLFRKQMLKAVEEIWIE